MSKSVQKPLKPYLLPRLSNRLNGLEQLHVELLVDCGAVPAQKAGSIKNPGVLMQALRCHFVSRV